MVSKRHPEQQHGEVWLTNTSLEREEITLGQRTWNESGFESIGWDTKRVGINAYDRNGVVIKGMVPVFVKRSEAIQKGLDPDSLFKSRDYDTLHG